MRKLLFYFIFIICSSSIIHCQIIKSFGPRVGLTYSDISTDFFPETYSGKTGLNFGLSSEMFPKGMFSLILELNYLQKGFNEEMVELNDLGEKIKDVKAENKLYYLSVPLHAKFRFEHPLNPYLSIGPRFDYLLNKENGVFHFSQGKFKSELLNYYKDFAYGASGAIGIEIQELLSQTIVLEFRYNMDFNNSVDENNRLKIKNRSIDFWLGLNF